MEGRERGREYSRGIKGGREGVGRQRGGRLEFHRGQTHVYYIYIKIWHYHYLIDMIVTILVGRVSFGSSENESGYKVQ